ncbi:TIMELESS-interacting protein [Brachionichthys hirsutus]|uniref:TIMELESS-interacting protein n=1 Tax=Brachionichthys hirsutus TaxID=412623 RepID=UPI003604552B
MSGSGGLQDEAFPPLPPPLSPSQRGRDEGDPFAEGDGDGDVSKLAEVPAAKRKGVKRPQPKLDAHRLISDRGLPALRTLFDNVRFKGKGHEAEDLRLLMQKMENWAHRLYPKLQFEDFIDKVEKLGKKKEVQTCLKRIRMDMPLTHEDFMGNDDDDAAPESHIFGDPNPFNGVSFPDDVPQPVHSTPTPVAPPAHPSLTEEQQLRMELNKQRALERKLARQQTQTDSQTAEPSSSADEPASVSSTNVISCNVQEEEVEDFDVEPANGSTQQICQPPHKDSEPPVENERETGRGRIRQPSDESGNRLMLT